MAVDHVQMALGHWNVDRLTQGAAGMMQTGQHINQLGEIAEIFDGGIAAAFIQITDEGRAINRSEHRVVAADHYIIGGIAGVLHIFTRGCFDQRTHQPAWKTQAKSTRLGCGRFHLSPSVFPHLHGFFVFVKNHADFLQNNLRIVFYHLELVVRERLIKLHLAADVARLLHFCRTAQGAARICPTTPTATSWSRLNISHGDASVEKFSLSWVYAQQRATRRQQTSSLGAETTGVNASHSRVSL